MEYLDDVKKYCNDFVLESIETTYKKIIGVESNPKIINENEKTVGKILLCYGDKKFDLNMIVEFDFKKIRWKSPHLNGEFGFYLINPYWAKNYLPDPKIEVPIKVFDKKTNKIITENRNLTLNQYMMNKLLDFYGNFQYKLVAAYENFYYLFRKHHEYYFAINSTVRNYKIKQDDLIKFISLVNHEKKRIKNKWKKHMILHLMKDQSYSIIEKLYGYEAQENQNKKIIKFKK